MEFCFRFLPVSLSLPLRHKTTPKPKVDIHDIVYDYCHDEDANVTNILTDTERWKPESLESQKPSPTFLALTKDDHRIRAEFKPISLTSCDLSAYQECFGQFAIDIPEKTAIPVDVLPLIRLRLLAPNVRFLSVPSPISARPVLGLILRHPLLKPDEE